MENTKYRNRVIDSKIRNYLEVFGAVCIEGPKWCGKTWTSAFHSNSAVYIGDPEGAFQNRRLAEMDPSLILDGPAPKLIDEWQDVPPIWDAVRYRVDQETQPGRYILTGSATPKHKGIKHSGAGRIAKIRMRPMSLYESGDSSGDVSLESLCDGEIKPVFTGDVSLQRIVDLIVRGGWSANIGLSASKAKLLPQKYLDAVLEDDVFRLDRMNRDSAKMRLLLRSLARNESTTVSHRKLKNDIQTMEDKEIDVEVVSTYLNIFDRLFLTDNLLPFAPNVRSSIRVKQMENANCQIPLWRALY